MVKELQESIEKELENRLMRAFDEGRELVLTLICSGIIGLAFNGRVDDLRFDNEERSVIANGIILDLSNDIWSYDECEDVFYYKDENTEVSIAII